MAVLIILVVLVGALVAVSVYRLSILRQGGTSGILRVLPTARGHGWRHGLIRYGEESLTFFQLSSLRPGPDRRISRQGIEVEAKRSPECVEFDLMTEDTVILALLDRDNRYEIALDRGAMTAFQSWLESRPPGNSQRGSRPGPSVR